MLFYKVVTEDKIKKVKWEPTGHKYYDKARITTEQSDGIYEPTTLVSPDIDSVENWPNIGISCTSNPNSTKRITTIHINPYDTSAVTPDYGTSGFRAGLPYKYSVNDENYERTSSSDENGWYIP